MVKHFPAIITLLAVALLFATSIAVGYARAKFGIKAPATTGNTDFERYFRVQMNTLENVVIFLPALWLFAMYVSNLWASIIGAVWLLGRCHYAVSYVRSAEARELGYAVGAAAFAVLLIGAFIGIFLRILAGT